jgi:PAS domain S-box-containing protein
MTGNRDEILKNRIVRLEKKAKSLSGQLAQLKEENRSNVKALKESRQILEELPGGVLLLQNRKIIFANTFILKELGLEREEIHNRDFLDLVHPSATELEANLYQRRVGMKTVPDLYETRLQTKGGDAFHCEIRVNKMRHNKRKAFLLSITGLNRRRIKEAGTLRAAKHEAIRQMAAGISHSLSHCLEALNNSLPHRGEIQGISDGAFHEHTQRLEHAQEKTTDVMRKMAALGTGVHAPSDSINLDLKKTLQDAVAGIKPTLKETIEGNGADIQLKTYLRTLSPVVGRPHDLKTAFECMILNAIEALPKGGEIYLTTEESSGFAHVYIQDSGIGIPEKLMDKLCDPFFTTKKDGHLGLGLSMARAIFERHKGEMDILSREGEGASFIVKIPLALKKKPSRANKRGTKIKDARIMIIAEEGMSKDLLSKLFQSKGCEVKTVPSSRHALKQLKKGPYHLVLADLSVPYLQPDRIIPKLKKQWPGTIVALVHSEKFVTVRDGRPRSFGADLIIPTPLDMDRVLKQASKLILSPPT